MVWEIGVFIEEDFGEFILGWVFSFINLGMDYFFGCSFVFFGISGVRSYEIENLDWSLEVFIDDLDFDDE